MAYALRSKSAIWEHHNVTLQIHADYIESVIGSMF